MNTKEIIKKESPHIEVYRVVLTNTSTSPIYIASCEEKSIKNTLLLLPPSSTHSGLHEFFSPILVSFGN